MTMSLKPYPAYKDSGVPSVGLVPEHWQVRRIQNAVDVRVSSVDKHTRQGEQPVRLCNYVDVYRNDRITGRTAFMRATATAEEIDRFRLQVGDVLITKDSEMWNDIGVPALVEDAADDLVCGYHLALLRPRNDVVTGSYLLRALQSPAIAYQFHVAANGVTRYGLSRDAIKSVRVPIPPMAEQAAIARFLEHADRLIRRYIHAKRRLVALLKEQRQAIIEHAVTRGLDPNVRLKPSGVEWLGEVPQHWDVLRSRYLFREVNQRSEGGEEVHLSMSQKLGLVPSSMMEEHRLLSDSYAGGKLCERNDLVLNRLKAHLGVFALATEPGVVSPDYTVFRQVRPCSMQYFELVLRSPACRAELRGRAKGLVEGFWRLYTDDFSDIRLPVPPVDEQERIVAALKDQQAEIDSGIGRAEREIDLIREYRARLIADIVTGKLDVREAAARLPEETREGEEAAEVEDVETDDAAEPPEDGEIDD